MNHQWLFHLLSEEELAKALGMSVSGVRKLRYKKLLPYVRIGARTVRFDLSRVKEALERLEIKEVS